MASCKSYSLKVVLVHLLIFSFVVLAAAKSEEAMFLSAVKMIQDQVMNQLQLEVLRKHLMLLLSVLRCKECRLVPLAMVLELALRRFLQDRA
ncbi:hypothetical protein ACLOJK_000613 [Asimina triloba]